MKNLRTVLCLLAVIGFTLVSGEAADARPLAVVRTMKTFVNLNAAVMTNGDLYVWGDGLAATLADGFAGKMGVPEKVALPESVNDVFLGPVGCATGFSGKLYCWGANPTGAVGGGMIGGFLDPTLVALPPSETVAAVAMGYDFVCALGTSGHVYCWGRNVIGSVGTGVDDSDFEDRGAPEAVVLPERAAQVYAAGWLACALLIDGKLFCWGDNQYRQIRNTPGIIGYNRPVQVKLSFVPRKIVTLGQSVCALDTQDQLWCWGARDYSLPGYDPTMSGDLYLKQPKKITFPGGAGVTDVGLDYNGGCALLSTGDLYCWGQNTDNRLGVLGQSYFVTPVRYPIDEAVAHFKAFGSKLCVQTVSGRFFCSGPAYLAGVPGQFGYLNGPTEVRIHPDTREWVQGFQHDCVVTSTGLVQCWGVNQYGQLGQGGFTTPDPKLHPFEMDWVSF